MEEASGECVERADRMDAAARKVRSDHKCSHFIAFSTDPPGLLASLSRLTTIDNYLSPEWGLLRPAIMKDSHGGAVTYCEESGMSGSQEPSKRRSSGGGVGWIR